MSNNLKLRALNLALEKKCEISQEDDAIFKLYQDFLYLKNKCNSKVDIHKENFINDILKIPMEKRLDYLCSSEGNMITGVQRKKHNIKKIFKSILSDIDIGFEEDAFIRSIISPQVVSKDIDKIFQCAVGYILDDLTLYFDATRPSRLEQTLNSDLEISPEQINYSKNLIEKIIKNKISKYNNQPIFKPKYGRDGVKKVLVIDQSYNDYSILKGLANETTFETMLNYAIAENPNADILIKTHPDSIDKNSWKPKCYYQKIQEKENIYKITEFINPISIIEYVDKVYVCTSQFGFEALMCGKEVHTFGMPFYAGWGLTIDHQICERRIRKRTLEEIFYIVYILFSVYLNPKTNTPCSIEDAIDFLLDYRKKYFDEYNIKCEL